jgi:CheY-like chemotaxis protein
VLLSCFFPTTVVCVDDKEDFLDRIEGEINFLNVTVKKFTDPYKALAYVNDVNRQNRLDCFDLAREGEESTSDWKSILLNINCLHREIYSFDRFSRISVVITDHSMPGMSGVEFSAGIADSGIQRVLLTGIADEKVAINAFNEGHISRFVKKLGENFADEVRDNISKSLIAYFKKHTEDLSKNLSVYGKTPLSDPIFASFFRNVCRHQDYVEYYMLDTFGGYLFLDTFGKPSFLCVLTEHEMENVISLAEESKEARPDVIAALKSKEYILASHSRSSQLPPIATWENYLRPARKLDGYQTYYFASVDSALLDLDCDNIKSFDMFRKRIAREISDSKVC